MAEIVNEGQIALNDIVFNIEGRVQRFLASRFAPKTVIGGYDDESDQVVSSFTFDDFSGGTGLKNIADASDRNQANRATLFTEARGLLSLAPRLVELAGSSSMSISADLVEHKGYIWSGTASAVRRYDHVNDTLDESKVNPGGIGTFLSDFQSGMLNDSAILVAVGDSGSSRAVTYSNSPTDSTAWSTDSSETIRKVAFWHDFLWGMNDSAELMFTPDITSGWTKTSRLFHSDDDTQITSLFPGPFFRNNELIETLFVTTRTGLFAYDNENERFSQPLFTLPQAPFNVSVKTAVWAGSVFMSHNTDLYRFTPGPTNVVDLVSPPFWGESATDSYGRIGNIAPGPAALYATLMNITDSDIGLYAFNGRKWSEFPRHISRANGDSTYFAAATPSLLFSGVEGKFRLYTTVSGSTARFVAAPIPVPADVITSDTTFLFRPNNTDDCYRFPFFDGFKGGTKLATSFDFLYDITDTSETFTALYRLDESDSFTQFANSADLQLTGRGSASFDITDSLGETGVAFDRIQFEVRMLNAGNSTHNNHTPIIRRMSLNYIKDQSLRWGYRVAIKTGSGQSPTETFRDLEALFTTNKLYDFTFRNDATGQPDVEKVKVLDLQSAEETGYGGHADYILTLVQAVA